MKKFLALLLCILMAFTVVACDKKDKDNDDDKGGNKSTSSQKSAVSFYVNYNSVKIELGAEAKAVLSALGTAKSSEAVGNCGGQGTLTKYVYDSIELYVLTSNGKDTVDQITLLDDAVQTAENLRIGSTKDDVVLMCGKGYSKITDTNIIYTSGTKNIKFTLRDDAVVGIDYLTLS